VAGSESTVTCHLAGQCGAAMMACAANEDTPQERCYVCAGNRLPGQPVLQRGDLGNAQAAATR
jgi:hypothetical protein